MQIQQLKYFIAVTERGSISSAAEELHISQPTISVAIKDLETELGHALLTRSPKGVRLTSFGSAVYKSIEKILEELENLKAPKAPLVSVCIIEANPKLVELVAAFSELNPDVRFFIKHLPKGGSDTTLYDFYVDEAPPPSHHRWFDHYPIQPKEFYAVLPAKNPLSLREIINPGELKDELFAFVTSSDMENYEQVYYMCIEHGFTPRIGAITDSAREKIDLLVQGVYSGIITSNWYECYTDSDNIRLVLLDTVENKGKYYSLYYSDKTQRNPYAMMFYDFVCEYLERERRGAMLSKQP